MSVKICAEIGINHQGDLGITKKLIDVAATAGCDYVKFQKRTPDICVPDEQKSKMRDTPWGRMTYIDYKYKVEFEKEEYDEIDKYCKEKNIGWFASAWDNNSVDFLSQYGDMIKVPSAHLTNNSLLNYMKNKFSHKQLSTGMSTEKEIINAIDLLDPTVIYHTNSVYPSPIDDLNLQYITYLKEWYPDRQIGYSNHYFGIAPIIAVTLLNVDWVEFHITLDRYMWGSDQLSSVEPAGTFKLVKGIRDLEKANKGYHKRKVLPGEDIKIKSLRG